MLSQVLSIGTRQFGRRGIPENGWLSAGSSEALCTLHFSQ